MRHVWSDGAPRTATSGRCRARSSPPYDLGSASGSPMAKKRSRALNVFYASVALALCVVPPFLLSQCQLDTTPIIKPHPPVESDDSDSGEDHAETAR